MSRIQNFFKRYSLPLFSGILIGTSYIPFPPWALAFCYAPLWLWTLRGMSSEAPSRALGWKVFRGGWIAQFILSLIGFHWIAYVSHEFGFMPWAAAVPVLFAFAALMNLYVPVS
jgi:apolipoprotein N-acyltransferase